MFADAGVPGLAVLNPFRWSDVMTLRDLISDLQGYRGQAQPVLVEYCPVASIEEFCPFQIGFNIVSGLEGTKRWQTFGSVQDAIHSLSRGDLGGRAHDVAFEERARAKEIICPGLAMMYNCGLLECDARGFATRGQLMAAMQRSGLSSPTVLAMSTEASKDGCNIFKLHEDPKQGHYQALKLCIPPPPSTRKWPEVQRFANNGRFSIDQLRSLRQHVADTKTKVEGKPDALPVVLAMILEMLGQRDGSGTKFIAEDDLRRFWMEGKPPAGWQPRVVSFGALTTHMTMLET